ncbi:hypothetical protein QAY90_gp54 [Xanthomonas phage Langgrundblatt2]|uniref:Uncharacterized protein n=2 Tax=Shirevirus TaxID=3153128 RepID=A0A9E7E331_9CAUD|nr:hypothetical protein QAY89_gp51 [Xanthomonas phage Langgrundblatt1]YP_010742934.1 hypothetical protein QAY90_gp54 [Xanthomonas phage Langgrundblatt2]URA06816.1 hypothetical protein Langgrundblatt1_BL10051 [Xanthomonas phage Langgrundblatt1]URA06885.1 hypothetical protein Langgrundblatt2_BL20054 [Xanthomonas phage Langgrundblatt2]
MFSPICHCNACHSRRVVGMMADDAKIESCEAQQQLDAAFAHNAAAQPVALDAVVEANRRLLLERSNVGVAKYGVTLAASGLSRRALLQHALEEALDLANYLQAELMRLDREGNEHG